MDAIQPSKFLIATNEDNAVYYRYDTLEEAKEGAKEPTQENPGTIFGIYELKAIAKTTTIIIDEK